MMPTSCLICKKRTGILGFVCSCNGNFCEKHRLREYHGCPLMIIKETVLLPKIVADKVVNRL